MEKNKSPSQKAVSIARISDPRILREIPEIEETGKRKCMKCKEEYSLSTASSSLLTHLRKHETDQSNILTFPKMISPKVVAETERLHEDLLAWMVDADIPYSELDRPSFRRFVEHGKFSNGLPCSKTVRTTLLDRQYDSIKKKLIDKLKLAVGISLTTDLWSQREQSFMGLTVHFVSADLEVEHMLLSEFH